MVGSHNRSGKRVATQSFQATFTMDWVEALPPNSCLEAILCRRRARQLVVVHRQVVQQHSSPRAQLVGHARLPTKPAR